MVGEEFNNPKPLLESTQCEIMTSLPQVYHDDELLIEIEMKTINMYSIISNFRVMKYEINVIT